MRNISDVGLFFVCINLFLFFGLNANTHFKMDFSLSQVLTLLLSVFTFLFSFLLTAKRNGQLEKLWGVHHHSPGLCHQKVPAGLHGPEAEEEEKARRRGQQQSRGGG